MVENRAALVAGDYHNGPLTVIITFGIWGALTFGWFLVAGFRVMRQNLRHGDERLRTINTTLLALFAGRVLVFMFVVGSFYVDMLILVGLVGFSVALNGGMARPPRPGTIPSPDPAGNPPGLEEQSPEIGALSARERGRMPAA